MSSADTKNTSEKLLDLKARLAHIKQHIPPHVRLIAVSKTFPTAIIRSAYAAGIRDFAENKVQESLAKLNELGDLTDVTWHFIGHIQSNKSRKVLEHFDWIHSLDSLKLAKRMDKQAVELGVSPNCCLQVKVMPDPNKDGFEPDELLAALPELDQLEQLKIRGLMVILPYGLSPEQARSGFAKARALAEQIDQQGMINVRMNQLSMGMSGDFESAIASGSTMVRIGSGLFGQR